MKESLLPIEKVILAVAFVLESAPVPFLLWTADGTLYISGHYHKGRDRFFLFSQNYA
jgi:hypothetical protein